MYMYYTSIHLTYILLLLPIAIFVHACLLPVSKPRRGLATAENQAHPSWTLLPEKWTVTVVILVAAMAEYHLLNQLPMSHKMCIYM